MTRAVGIDISKYQEAFNPDLATERIDFVIQRASWAYHRDELFDLIYEGVKKIPERMAYHYYSSGVPWQTQADFFLEQTDGKGFRGLMVDYEHDYNKLTQRTANELKLILEYLRQKKPNLRILGYSNTYTYRDNIMPFVDLSGFDWVFARYPANPDPQADEPVFPAGCREDWKAWQYSSTGDGPAHGCQSAVVDLDVFHGTVEELQAFLGVEEPQPTPPPEPTELELALQEIAELKKEKAELEECASVVISAARGLEDLIRIQSV